MATAEQMRRWCRLSNLPAHFSLLSLTEAAFLKGSSFLLKVYQADARGMIEILHKPVRMKSLITPQCVLCVRALV